MNESATKATAPATDLKQITRPRNAHEKALLRLAKHDEQRLELSTAARRTWGDLAAALGGGAAKVGQGDGEGGNGGGP